MRGREGKWAKRGSRSWVERWLLLDLVRLPGGNLRQKRANRALRSAPRGGDPWSDKFFCPMTKKIVTITFPAELREEQGSDMTKKIVLDHAAGRFRGAESAPVYV